MAYFSIDMLIGLSEADLLTLKADALTSLKSDLGKVQTSVSAPGISTTFLATLAPQEIIRACMYALKKLDSTTYGAIVTRTRVNFP